MVALQVGTDGLDRLLDTVDALEVRELAAPDTVAFERARGSNRFPCSASTRVRMAPMPSWQAAQPPPALV
jgi:hypothetical protein